MHNNAQQQPATTDPWLRLKQAGPNQYQPKDNVVSKKPKELESAQLKALKASPLYSPQSVRPRSIQQSRAHSGQKPCPFETTFDDKERRFPMYNGERRPQASLEFRQVDMLSDADDARLSAEIERLYEVRLR